MQRDALSLFRASQYKMCSRFAPPSPKHFNGERARYKKGKDNFRMQLYYPYVRGTLLQPRENCIQSVEKSRVDILESTCANLFPLAVERQCDFLKKEP